MEITIKSLRVIKEGEQAKSGQPYKWISVMANDGSEKGTEYTTFDTGILKLGAGSVIDIGDPVIKEGKLSFKKIVSIVSEVQASEAPAVDTGGAYKRDTEAIRLEYGLKATLQAIERASIESQTAYNGIVSLASTGVLSLENSYVGKALEWAGKKMAATLSTAAPSEPTGAKSDKGKAPAPSETPAPAAEEEPIAPSFPHVGALLKWCAEKGIDRKAFMSLVGVKEEDLARVDIETAYTLINDHLREKGQLVEDIFGSSKE